MATPGELGELVTTELRERVERLFTTVEKGASDLLEVASLADEVGELADKVSEIYSELDRALSRGLQDRVADDDLISGPAGVRAQAIDPDGSLVDDFRIHRLGPVIALRNAPSPGATSSMAIADYLVEEALHD